MNLPASRSAQNVSPATKHAQNVNVSIVVCTRNRSHALRACLEAVRALQPAPDEVLVVDNSAGDAAAQAVAEEAGARYVVEPVQGLSRARNRGMKESTCEVVAYLDDDATPEAGWLGALLEPFTDPQIAATTGRVLTPQTSTATTDTVRYINRQTPQWFEIATFGGLGLGSNMALRRTACGTGKMFDERLGRGAPFRIAEENYAFARLLASGFTVAYVPTAVVFHPPLKWGGVEEETRNSLTYGLLLLSEFPEQRGDLIRFLIRRLRRKSLTWPRNPQEPGQIINSGWSVRLRAGFSALYLFLRTRKPRD